MTLIIGMYYNNKKGALIASDSRVLEGFNIIPSTQKLFKIQNSIFAFTGTLYLRDELIEELEKLGDGSAREKVQEVYLEKREKYLSGDNPKLKKKDFSCETMLSFYKDGIIHLINVNNFGVMEPFYKGFSAIGQNDYANIILNEIYQERITKQQAINSSIYCIAETAKINGGVDNDIQLALIEKNECKILNLDKKGKFNFQKPEFEEIKKKLEGIYSLHTDILRDLLNGREEDKSKLEKLLKEINSQ